MPHSNLNFNVINNLSAILDNIDTGYVLYDADSQICAFNNQAQKFSVLLYGKKLAVGSHLLSYFPKMRHDYLLHTVKKVLKGDKIVYEVCFDTHNGQIWLEINWLHVLDIGNSDPGFILSSKDITESKLHVIDIEKSSAEIVNRNKTLEQFGNVVGHNLKSPVANIVSIVQLINSSETEEEKDLYLTFIDSSAQALSNVVDDISRLLAESRNFAEVKEVVNFEELLSEIKTTVNYLVIKDHVTIRSDFKAASSVFSVKSFVTSIFYNLISNSIKYRREDVFPEITISSEQIVNGVTLKFGDNGRGLDLEKHAEDLFGLHKRFHLEVEGSGLGLYMVKQQVEQIGGTINVESTPGAGTTFIVNIINMVA